MINKDDIIDEIVKYYMNPKKYLNVNKNSITKEIKKLDDILLNGSDDTEELLGGLFQKYSSGKLDSEIVKTIYKTRADEQGVKATIGYREIYFNEIIQNANDNTDGDKIDIIISKTEKYYEMTFSYKDKGFSVENIIGFFNTEIHTKRDNLSTTGKHGVGIKSLFYFVDYMKIESNVKIEFSIDTTPEDGEEKIIEATSNIEKNDKWYENRDKITYFTIRFPSKKEYGTFNIDKLKRFIDLFYKNGEISDTAINEYYFGFEQTNLIFDTRGLIFTDKNKGKDIGIKKLSFYKGDMGVKLFDISCECLKHFKNDHAKVEFSVIKYNDITKLEYIVFTKEGKKKEQNFSVAFPVELECSKKRYYETYYLPEADEEGINILINSGYSNVARTKLADDDSKISAIKEEIDDNITNIYGLMVNEGFTTSEIGSYLSQIFHKLLVLDDSFKKICYENGYNNRYLLKYEAGDYSGKYIVYKRENKEEYEKKLIGQSFSKEEIKSLFEKYIIKNDSIEYNENLFLDEVKEAYIKAFNEQEQKLKHILNIAGTIKELIYYRIKGYFPNDTNINIEDTDIDNWNNKNWEKEEGDSDKKTEKIKILLSIIGRYGLNSNITNSGEIKGASFYEYLFNDEESVNDNGNINANTLTIRAKGQELYNEQYGKLKERLLDLLVNKEQEGTVNLYGSKCEYKKGTVVFYGSWDNRAGTDLYFDRGNVRIYNYKDSNSDSFGEDLTTLLVKKMIEESEILNHIVYFGNRLMLASREYPGWGEATFGYKRNYLLRTGEWKICKLINLNFLRTIYVHSWENFKFYFKTFFENEYVLTYFRIREWEYANKYIYKYMINIYTYKDETPLFDVKVKDFDDIFHFFCDNSRYQHDGYKSNYNFKVKFNEDIDYEKNLCPIDYFDYLQEHLGVKVYVMQTHSIKKSSKQLMYCYNNEFKISGMKIGEGIRETKNEIIIIHTEKLDYKKAISSVLQDIVGKNDIVAKCEAFIPANQNDVIQGEDYNRLVSHSNEGNSRSKKGINMINSRGLSVKALTEIIKARGNNDNKCCCCGQELVNSRLIITNNRNKDTQSEYPQIREVVCEKCWNVLNKSHKNTNLLKKEDGNYYVEYCCDIQNSHQSKEVIFKSKICDGVLALCKK